MSIPTITWTNNAVKIIDQRKLPGKLEFIVCRDVKTLWKAIRVLAVRGAPALGVAAAFAVLLGIKNLLFVKRKLWLQILYFLIFGATIYFYFLEPAIKNQVVVFVFLTLLTREAYSFLTENREVKNLLIGLICGLLFVETSWVVSLLPLSRLASSIFVVVVLFTAHDVIMNNQSNRLSKTISRDFVLSALILMVLFIFSLWSLT
jgi:hypothetical protein